MVFEYMFLYLYKTKHMFKYFVVYCLLHFYYYTPALKRNQSISNKYEIDQGFLIIDTVKIKFYDRFNAAKYLETIQEAQALTTSVSIRKCGIGIDCAKLDSVFVIE